jgi:RHS repeat-associated protein
MLIDSSEGTTKTYYFQLDDLNTVHALLDDSGTAVERYDYSAYGETRIQDSNGQTVVVDDDADEEFDVNQDGIIDIGYPRAGEPVTPRVVASQSLFDNPFGYAGMRRDEHSGLYHTHYREYNPNLGRWLTPDPAGYVDGQNLYAYYPNVNGVDPLGLWGVQFGDTNIGRGQPSIAFGEGSHVTGEVGFVHGLSQGAEDTLYGRDRNLSSDIAVGMTPVGIAHDGVDG